MRERYPWQLRKIREDAAAMFGGRVTSRDIFMQATGLTVGFFAGAACAALLFIALMWVES
ncbi:MAG: hypothetical protein CML68_13740 [Rhodobacteraceae bacterium]|nr:hypothetical protein [Paracoccaceae bacterium]